MLRNVPAQTIHAMYGAKSEKPPNLGNRYRNTVTKTGLVARGAGSKNRGNVGKTLSDFATPAQN